MRREYNIDVDALTAEALIEAIERSPLNCRFAAWEVVDGGVMFFATCTDHDTWCVQL